MECLTRDQILASKDLEVEKVDVPQWQGFVFVRSLNGKERDAFEASCLEKKGKTREVNMLNLRAKLVSLACVNAEGVRLFTEADIAAIGEKNAGALDTIFSVAQRLSGIGEKDKEDLVKNTEPDQS